MLPVTRSDNAMADMAKVMEKVRSMRDSQLADVLAGKDMSIPQYAAMAEAMGRRQLREAVKGAQAQQQAQQPSVKDQLMMADAQEAGLAALPAPNMASMDLASGGIVAFNGTTGSQVELSDEEFLRLSDPEKYARQKRQSDAWKSVADSGKPYSVAEFRQDVVDPFKSFFTAPFDKAAADKAEKAEIAKIMKEKNIGADEAALIRGLQKQTGDKEGDFPMYTPKPVNYKAAANPAAASPDAAPSAANPNAPASGLNYLLAGSKFERRASPFGSFSPEEVDYNKLKDQGMGEGLMKMGAGLLSAPGSKGFAAGIQALAESGQISRKEIAGLKKDARDYKLNVAKAEEAFNQGQDELGFKYMENANLNKYRMAALAQEPGELRTLRAIAADPTLAAYAKSNKGVMSITDATKEFNDMAEKNPAMYRELKKMGITTPRDYLTYATTGLPPGAVSATVPEGAKTRS